MDKRQKLTCEQVEKIHEMLDQGMTLDAIARTHGISSSHVHRIKAAYYRGEVNLKPTSLCAIVSLIEQGLPFRRRSWPEKLFCYYDVEDKWFIQANEETGCELVVYRLDLSIEDLAAKDWIVLTLEIMDHIVNANKKVVE
jgi:hypothetical protein